MHEPRGEEIEALVDVVGLGPGKETDAPDAERSWRASAAKLLGHGTGWTLDAVAGITQMAFRATDRTGHTTGSQQ
jgi:hypothetical protein